jgi:hypothetical protein
VSIASRPSMLILGDREQPESKEDFHSQRWSMTKHE